MTYQMVNSLLQDVNGNRVAAAPLRAASQIGDRVAADYHQECLLCRRAIHRGEVAKAGARNTFSDELLWFHPRCADFILRNFGPGHTMVDDGWRQARFDQRCHICSTLIHTGNLIYRVARWADEANPLTLRLEWACPNCHRADTAPHLTVRGSR